MSRRDCNPPQYDLALSRALEKAISGFSRLEQWPAEDLDRRVEALLRLPPGRQVTVIRSSRRLRSPFLVDAVLDAGARHRFSDPRKTLQCARLARLAAEGLAETGCSRALQLDQQAKAAAHEGNALRILARFPEAEQALLDAEGLADRGTGDPLLQAKILDFTASLRNYQRRFDEALALVQRVFSIHLHLGDYHAAGRALVSKAMIYGYRADPNEATVCLNRALLMLDRQRSPRLYTDTLHNLAWFCLDADLVDAAKKARAMLKSEIREPVGELAKIRFHWLDARLAAKSGADDLAGEMLETVRSRFREAGLEYEYAVVTLDLAATHLARQDHQRVAQLAAEILPVFAELKIEREAVAALLLLETAAQREEATAALLDGAVAALRRARLAVAPR